MTRLERLLADLKIFIDALSDLSRPKTDHSMGHEGGFGSSTKAFDLSNSANPSIPEAPRARRQSESRDTSVPSSGVSGPISIGQESCTAYLEIPKASLDVLTSTSYDDMLQRYKAGTLPDAQQIIALATDV